MRPSTFSRKVRQKIEERSESNTCLWKLDSRGLSAFGVDNYAMTFSVTHYRTMDPLTSMGYNGTDARNSVLTSIQYRVYGILLIITKLI